MDRLKALYLFQVLILAKGWFSDTPCDVQQCICREKTKKKLFLDCSNYGNCNLTSLPVFENLSCFNQTVYLNMSSCNSLKLPSNNTFDAFSNLRILDLSNTSLNANNVSFIGLTKLKYLTISNNFQFELTNDSVLVNKFKDLESLEELRAYGTTGTYSRKGYPESLLAHLISLKELWIDARNVLFGQRFRDFKALKVLRISGDMIYEPWRSLEFCDMINITNETLQNLVHVEKLYIRKCGLQNIALNAFQKMTSLKYLDLSYNERLTVRNALLSFGSLSSSVKEVYLDHIEDMHDLHCGVMITADISRPLQNTSIEKLSLEGNKINFITSGTFANIPLTLQHLNLSYNEFRAGVYVFRAFTLSNLTTLRVTHNFFPNNLGIWQYYDGQHLKQNFIASHSFGGTVNDMNIYYARRKADKCNHDTCTPGNEIHRKFEAKEHSPYLKQYKTDDKENTNENPLVDDMERVKVCPSSDIHFPPKSITIYLPPKLRALDVSFSKLGVSIPNLYIEKNNSLREIRAAGSLLYCWDGPVYGIEQLEFLDLSLNDCSKVSIDFFTQCYNLQDLDLSGNRLSEVVSQSKKGELFRNNKKLKRLNLSYNQINFVPKNFFINQKELENLDISHNSIRHFEVQLEHMTHLSTLNLSNNNIYTLDEFVRQQISKTKRNLYVDLTNTSLECNCGNIQFLQWLYNYLGASSKLKVIANMCYDGSSDQNILYIQNQNDLKEIQLQLEKTCASYISVIVVMSIMIFAIFNFIVGVIVHRFRWSIRYWYYVAKPPKKGSRGEYVSIDHDNQRYKYDVYVVSVNEDSALVLGRLKPRLSTTFGLFLQDKDIIPGQNMYSAIANAIHVSKVALFVVSKNCEQDPDWQIAIRFAQQESLKRGHRMYIGLFYNIKEQKEWSLDIHELQRVNAVEVPSDDNDIIWNAFWNEFECLINEAILLA